MNTIIEKKINNIFKNLIFGIYHDPFTKPSNIHKFNFKLIPDNMIYNGCRATGFYENKMCEIINSNYILTSEQHEHLKLIKTKWNMIPHLLIIDNDEIIEIKQYKVNNTIQKSLNFPDNSWIAASRTRNYLLDDPLIDFLKYKNTNTSSNKRKHSFDETPSNETFMDRIFAKGNEFEKEIIDKIKLKFPEHFIQIGESYEAKSYDKYLKTVKAIQDKVPIIYQPVLWNHTNKTFGCGDLIIRSNFAHNLFPSYDNSNEIIKYEVYDIKWSNIRLRAETDEILNESNAKAYKSQILIYTDALNEIQTVKATRGYVIGKSYHRERTVNKKLISEFYSDPFEKLGIIDYVLETEIVEKTNEAIEWLKEIQTNDKLNIDPPNDPRLFPNMKNNYDNEFSGIKRELAKKNNEITLLYSVGAKQRKLALDEGIREYNDPLLNSHVLGFSKNSKKGKMIDGIIEINRINSDKKILWHQSDNLKDLSNLGYWKTSKIKCYVDIETINNTVYNIDKLSKNNYIFMIGLGVVVDGIWSFFVYTVNKMTLVEEHRILKEFEMKLNEIVDNNMMSDEPVPVFHWSNFENINLKPYIDLNNKIQFYDMCKWFMDEEVCIKGALDYKLKNVVSALNKNDLLDIRWPLSSGISNGMNAMNEAYKYYKNEKTDKTIIKDIEKYNEIDCKSMWSIHEMFKSLQI